MTPTTASDAREIADLVKGLHSPTILDLPDGNRVLVLPQGLAAHNLKPFMEPYLTAPERRKGSAVFTDLASFIAHVRRFADADSAIFACDDEERPSFLSVLDYHRAGADASPRFGQHRASYAPEVSEAWAAWAEAEGEVLSVADFNSLLQERLADVVDPPKDSGSEDDARLLTIVAQFGSGGFGGQSRLLELSKGLRIRDTQEIAGFSNTQSGEVEISFKNTVTGADGAPLTVPAAFVVGVPVFDRGAAYRMIIRLMYRNVEGRIRWLIKRHRPDVIFEHAFDEAAKQIVAETALPLFRGKPE